MSKVRILIPPGIGDAYWVLVKLRSFLKHEGLEEMPELTVVSYPSPTGAHLRSIPFLKMFNFLSIGNPTTVPNDPGLQPIWDEAYLGPGRSIFPGVMGFDYFLSWNGRINSGGWLEDDDMACEWFPLPGPNISNLAAKYRDELGRYAVCFWPMYGSYESHVRQFSIDQIAAGINGFLSAAGLKCVFVGADWDIELNAPIRHLMNQLDSPIDLIGQTSLAESFGVLAGAELVAGYHAGLTNMAVVFGVPTVLLWDDRYPESTSLACVPPDRRGTTYSALRTSTLTADQFMNEMLRLWRANEVHRCTGRIK